MFIKVFVVNGDHRSFTGSMFQVSPIEEAKSMARELAWRMAAELWLEMEEESEGSKTVISIGDRVEITVTPLVESEKG